MITAGIIIFFILIGWLLYVDYNHSIPKRIDNDSPAVDCHRKFCLLSDDLFKQLCVIDSSAKSDSIGNLRCWDFCDYQIQFTAVLKLGTPPKTFILYDNKITKQKKKFYKYEKFVEFFEQHNLEIKQQILQHNINKDFT